MQDAARFMSVVQLDLGKPTLILHTGDRFLMPPRMTNNALDLDLDLGTGTGTGTGTGRMFSVVAARAVQWRQERDDSPGHG
jgi:hypothetical protein